VFDLAFTVDAQDTTTPLTLAIDQAVIAGWTGRDPVARDKHIAELEAIGIAPRSRRRSITGWPHGGSPSPTASKSAAPNRAAKSSSS
jgi:hypothetical protein